MDLKCKINGKEYQIEQGIPFAEELNEKLDSMAILIPHVKKIDMQPFDDVFIYDGEFNGYSTEDTISVNVPYSNLTARRRVNISYSAKTIFEEQTITAQNIQARIRTNTSNIYVEYNLTKQNNTFYLTPKDSQYDEIELQDDGLFLYFTYTNNEVILLTKFILEYSRSAVPLPDFYRHYLVDQYAEELVNIDEQTYNYKIELFSEIKALERIQLPNFSITQARDIAKKKSVWEYLNMLVEQYSPLEKIATDLEAKTWKYRKKYKLSSGLREIYENVYSPDFTLNSPSLRDVLTQLFLTKDRIPYVYNNVIYGLDISSGTAQFNDTKGQIITIVGSMSSDNYCDGLKRTYNSALAQENSARLVEYIGFRNRDNSLMTIGTMRVETKFPIYKINKIYLCYYKKGNVVKDGASTGQKVFLCKQDITKLIKINNERNLLVKDWDNFTKTPPTSIDEMAQYRLCTLGYDIGARTISGWGESYKYQTAPWFSTEKTYVENIINLVDSFTPYGIYEYGYITKLGNLADGEEFSITGGNVVDNIVNPFSNNSLAMKSFFFIVDYQAFYNGTIVHSKDNARDDIITNDSTSNSLMLLERDGMFEKEKANRFGNPAIVIQARYSNYNDIQPLGSVYKDNIIIYHREYAIYDNYIECTYFGTKNYVLKNYYTSVYAKIRPYNLLTYDESTRRSDNKKEFILLSKDKSYYEKDITFLFNNFNGDSPLGTIMSFLKPSPQAITIDYFDYKDKINYGYFVHNNKYYASDINAFVSGNSLCFNITMEDNVSMGVFIKTPEPTINPIVAPTNDDYTGSVQSWTMLVDDPEIGFAENYGIYVGHIDQKEAFLDGVYNYSEYQKEQIDEIYSDRIFGLPTITAFNELNVTNIIGNEYKVNKDNKEMLDMTFQFEPITENNDILFSPWVMKLSDMLSTYNKVAETYITTDVRGYDIEANVICFDAKRPGESGLITNRPGIIIEINESDLSKLELAQTQCFIDYPKSTLNALDNFAGGFTNYFSYNINKIVSVSNSEIVTSGTSVVKVDRPLWSGEDSYTNDDIQYTFRKVTKIGNNAPATGKLWFTNLKVENEQVQELEIGSGNALIYYDSNGNRKLVVGYAFSCDKEFYINQTINSNTANYRKMYLNSAQETKTKTYRKNMYLVLSQNKMKKTLVYSEFAQLNTSTLAINSVFSLKEHENGTISIRTDLAQVPSTTKSIQYWYFDQVDNCYKFVFGVNAVSSDFERGYIDIYMSLLSKRDTRVYDTLHNLIGSNYNYVATGSDKSYGENQYYSDIIINEVNK